MTSGTAHTAGGGLRRTVFALAMALLAVLPASVRAAEPPSSPTLEAVRDRGILRCGVTEASGYAWRDGAGRMHGFRVDLCRAVAAAVLHDSEAVEFVPLIAGVRFETLMTKQVDLIAAGATWTLSREAGLGLSFTGAMLHDGQGFVARRESAYADLAAADGARVCVVSETTSEKNLLAWQADRGVSFTLVRRATQEGSWDAFLARACDLLTNDRLEVAVTLVARAPAPTDYVMLPDTISREPLSPAVRNDDPLWESIVRFTMQALLLGEATGYGRAALDQESFDPASVRDPEARRLLGIEPGVGAPLGLDDLWARRVLTAVGHYGEIFDRNLGSASIYRLERGPNALWRNGGLMMPLPLW